MAASFIGIDTPSRRPTSRPIEVRPDVGPALDAKGEFEPLTEGSTRPVTTVTHAGIVNVERYEAFGPPEPVQRTVR